MSFDMYADEWDTEARVKRAKCISDEIGRVLTREKYETAMEFGCGTGLISFNLLDRFEKATLVDSSTGMIDVLHKKILKYNVDNIEPLHVDVTSQGIQNRTFDAIYSSLVLHHIVGIEDILREFYNLLNEDGELCIVDIDEEDGRFHRKYPEFDGHNGFNHDELRGILESLGYKDIEIRTFYNGEKTFEGEKIDYSLFVLRAQK